MDVSFSMYDFVISGSISDILVNTERNVFLAINYYICAFICMYWPIKKFSFDSAKIPATAAVWFCLL